MTARRIRAGVSWAAGALWAAVTAVGAGVSVAEGALWVSVNAVAWWAAWTAGRAAVVES